MKLIRSSVLLFFVVLFIPNLILAQAYDSPESAVYDAVNDLYLISNMGDGDINGVRLSDPGTIVETITGAATSIRGIAISGVSLWAAGTANDGTSQVFLSIELVNGTVYNSLTITEGNFVNDVTLNLAEGKAYLSDNNNIYIIDLATNTYSVLLQNAGANGLLFDEANNRLLYTDDTPTTGSAISAIDLTTNNKSTLITNANFSGLDGLTVDHLGNYYVSCWSNPNAVYRYDQNFTSSTIASTGYNGVDHNGAADIFYDQVNNVLVVPNMNANTVDFIPFNRLPTLTTDDISVIPFEFQLHQNFPNPFNPTTTIFYDISKESNVKVTVFDLLGRKIVTLVDQIEPPGSRSINWDGRDYTGNLVNAGVYIYQIEADAFIQTKKMVLLK